ncbi:MAG: AAA family ATPase [Bacteroidia bacterium]|nr:AAA family ATPase [Bacteroidia bacterium]
MPQQTKIFRVFVSSTFTDMKLERSILQSDAFPKLEKFCEEKGAKFQAVDLRWGVNEESSQNQKTIQICFNEIARCQKISPKPNFLILLGDKYGWQPIPEIIPEDEMNAILGVLNGIDKELIQKWYQRDENAIPAEYVLQPKGEQKDYLYWEPIEKDLRNILRAAVEILKFPSEQRIKYFASATHQEIIKGALNPPDGSESSEKHVFAFSRTIAKIPKDKSAVGFIDLVDDIPDEDSKTKLDELKKELLKKLGVDHFKKYDGEWKNGTLHIGEKELQQFNDDVLEKLKNIINEQLALVVDKDEINHEVKLHGEFKTRLTEHFEGREDILKIIKNYLDNRNEKRVMSLIGASGTGKSSVMAQSVKLNENKGATLVYRFIGTTSGSSNIMSLLQSVCGEMARAYGIDAKTLAREGDEKAWYDMNGLADVLRKCLALATERKPILLFLDSLDQLSETDNAKALYWLPRELPDHARLVVSTLPELEPALNATYKEPLLVMPVEQAKKILGKWFSSIHRMLTKEQEELVINSFSKNKLPIYLKLAFEKAKKWHSYDTGLSLNEDVPGIINDFFDELQKDYPEDFVKTVICYTLCGRYSGLAENEILEILAFDPEYWQKFIEP